MVETTTRRQLLLASLALAAAPLAQAQDKACAIVLMHGKWGNTQYLRFFGRRMQPYCEVRLIEMPWSKRRNYDASYPQALDEIAAQVQKLRAEGFQRVVLMGHSFGANAALAYMATQGDADAVVALAPGHSPAAMYARGIGRAAVDEARTLVAAGQGAQTLTMDDLNQGRRQNIRMRADVLLSYFDPQGLGDMPSTAAAFKKPVPLLWVVGTGDPLYPMGQGYGFDRAPAHAHSQYLVYQGGHEGFEGTAEQVLEWVKAMP